MSISNGMHGTPRLLGQPSYCPSVRHGYSPYFMAHGVEAVLPLDIAEATYLLPPLNVPTSTEDLQLRTVPNSFRTRPEDLREMFC